MTDYTRLLQKILPQPEVGSTPQLRLRSAVVAAVNSDGTVDLTVSEVEVPDVPVLNGVIVAVGSVVQVLVQQGAMLVLGTTANAASLDSSVAFSTSAITPLVSAANTNASIITLSHAFKAGFAYRISWTWCAQFTGGTSPFVPFTKIARSSASGTAIDDIGGGTAITTNFHRMDGSTVVKCTSANTTQTIVLIGGFSTTGSPTSMDVEAASTRRTRLEIQRIGTATKYSGALEVPTA
jgi:hypothetical protein